MRSSRPRKDLYADSVLRSQRDLRLQPDLLARDNFNPPPLRNRRQRKNCLHPGKRFPNTLPPTATKGKIGKPRPASLGLLSKTFRTEPLRIGKPLRIPLDNVLAEKNHSSLAKPIRPD